MVERIDYAVDGIPAAGWVRGRGKPLLLMHGSGPGAASEGTWRLVIDELASAFRVFTTDLIGFGQSGRKTQQPFFDMALWQRQADAILDRIDGDSVGVVGHSVSGPIALRLAADHARVDRVLTTATMGHAFVKTEATPFCWTVPANRDALRHTLRLLICDPALITEQMLDARETALQDAGYREHFAAMFAGDAQRYIDAAAMRDEEFARITCPVAMIHGRDDVMFPAEGTTLPMSAKLPQADIHLLAACRHLPPTEHPHKVLRIMLDFFA